MFLLNPALTELAAVATDDGAPVDDGSPKGAVLALTADSAPTPPGTQADFGSVRLYKGPPTSEQPAAAPNTQRGPTPHTQRGSTPPSRAKLTASTPAEGNDAPPRTQADFCSVRLYKGPPISEQPAAAPNTQRGSTPHTQRGSTPPSRAKLTAPTPAAGNDAAGLSGAGQSGSVEASPPATHAPARV